MPQVGDVYQFTRENGDLASMCLVSGGTNGVFYVEVEDSYRRHYETKTSDEIVRLRTWGARLVNPPQRRSPHA